MKMKFTHEVEIQPFGTPNFILTVMPPGKRQDGFLEAPKIAISQAEPEMLSRLCDEFRREIFEKAGKPDPRLKD